jgi:hypothetical protein
MKILWGDLWLNLDLETIVNLDFIIIELVLTWENIGKPSIFLKVKGEFLYFPIGSSTGLLLFL